MKTKATIRRKDSGWQLIISWKDEAGSWHQKSKQGFARKSDAQEAEAELIQSIKKQPHPVDKAMKDITLIQFCEEYLEARKSIIHGSKVNYKNAVKALGGLANEPLSTITFRQLQKAVSGWEFAPATQSNYRIFLKALFAAAIKPYKLITDNPMDDIEIAKARDKKQRRTLTDAEYRKLLEVLKDDPEATLAANILYYTGLRRGEMMGLSWDKISWKEATMTIDTQYNKTKTGRLSMQTPKSRNGFRDVPIPTKLLSLLKQYHDTYPMRLDRRLFSLPVVVIRRVCVAMRNVHPDLSPHCLRHTYATRLLSQGVDVRTVAALIGDDTETVIRTYIHYTDEMRRAAKNDIEKIFSVNF